MITPAYALTATERVLPRLALDFTTASLDARVTVTRALDTATRFNSSGLIETVNANLPRFDYDPITKVCRGLLIEETRVQTSKVTENIGNWSKSSTLSSLNVAVAPDGTQTADLVYPSSSGNNRQVYLLSNGAPTSGTAAISVFAKDAGKSWVIIYNFNTTTPVGWFNVSTGAVGTAAAGWTLSIQPAENGFYRCIAVGTLVAGQYVTFGIADADNSVAVTASGTNGIYFWGSQVEAGTFATSYIRNTGTAASVTRNADEVKMTGTNFSSWFNASEGTFVVTTSVLNLAADRPIMQTSTGGLSNGSQYVYYNPASSRFAYRVYDAGGAVVGAVNYTNAGTPAVNTTYCVAIGYKTDSFAISANGAAVGLDTAGTVTGAADTLLIGSDTAITYLNGHAKALDFYPLRLLNAETQAFSKG